MTTDQTPRTNQPAARRFAATVHALVRAMPSLSPGEIAELRRQLSPEHLSEPGGASFWKLAARYLEPDWLDPGDPTRRESQERSWGFLVGAVASLFGQHRRDRSLGEALATAGVSEPRLLQLCRSEGDRLLDDVRAVVHRLKASGEPVDVADLCALVHDGAESRDGEGHRRRLARQYYRVLHRTATAKAS